MHDGGAIVTVGSINGLIAWEHDEASFVTGAALVADGGTIIRP